MTAEAPARPAGLPDSTASRWLDVARTWGLDPAALPGRRPDSDWRPHLSTPGAGPDRAGPRHTWTELAEPHDALAGIGQEGLGFTAAKAAVRPGAGTFAHGHLLVDAMNGIVVLDGEPIPSTVDPEVLRRILLHDGVLQLTVVAHGDGGHLKLPGLVGCGLTLDTERDLADGRPSRGGCVAGVRCQRSPDLATVVACRDMRVAAVVLMACKAGLLTDSLRPSTTNAALAFLEGHALGVLAPAGLCTSTPAISKGLLRLDQPGDTEAVRAYLTDVAAAPFRLLGSPLQLPLTPAPTTTAGVVVHRVAPGPGGRVAWWTDRSQQLRPGSDTCFAGSHLVLPAAATRACVTVAAEDQPLGALTREWRGLLDSIRLRGGQLAAALDDVPNTVAGGLAAARREVEGAVAAVLERHAAAREHGMAVRMQGSPPAIQDGVRGWQEAVLDAVEELLDSADVLSVFGTGLWERATTATDERCGACAGPLARTTLADPLSGHESVRLDCRNCGSKRLQPASRATPVRMTVDRAAGAVTFTGADSGAVLVSCACKGFPAPATVRHDLAAQGPLVALPVPAGIPDELLTTTRTLRAVLADGAAVHVWKERL